MELINLVTAIHRYCSMNGIKTTKVTISELTNHMIIEATEEKDDKEVLK